LQSEINVPDKNGLIGIWMERKYSNNTGTKSFLQQSDFVSGGAG